jgi:hypothetical protein
LGLLGSTARGDSMSSTPRRNDRAETGAMQFGDDWPGVFIRGDHAAAYVMALSQVLERTKTDDIAHSLAVLQCAGLLNTLRGCDARSNPTVQLLRSFDEAQSLTESTE